MAILFSYAAHLMDQPLLRTLTTGTFLAFLAAFVQFQSAALSSVPLSSLPLGGALYERATPDF